LIDISEELTAFLYQMKRVSHAITQQQADSKQSSAFLRDVSEILLDYMASHPRR
jgi:hypothetical protein